MKIYKSLCALGVLSTLLFTLNICEAETATLTGTIINNSNFKLKNPPQCSIKCTNTKVCSCTITSIGNNQYKIMLHDLHGNELFTFTINNAELGRGDIEMAGDIENSTYNFFKPVKDGGYTLIYTKRGHVPDKFFTITINDPTSPTSHKKR